MWGVSLQTSVTHGTNCAFLIMRRAAFEMTKCLPWHQEPCSQSKVSVQLSQCWQLYHWLWTFIKCLVAKSNQLLFCFGEHRLVRGPWLMHYYTATIQARTTLLSSHNVSQLFCTVHLNDVDIILIAERLEQDTLYMKCCIALAALWHDAEKCSLRIHLQQFHCWDKSTRKTFLVLCFSQDGDHRLA